MTNVKRTLSALLAVAMVFTTMTIAFTVIGSAATGVPRVASTQLSPNVEFTVPDVIETWGTDYYQAGPNVKAVGQITATFTSAVGEVKDVSLMCSDAGVPLSARVQQGDNGYVWTIQNGGVLKTEPADDGSTVVKWTLSCTVGAKEYVTYAWSQVQPVYNNPGFSVHLSHENTLGYDTHNHHVEWIQPVLGTPATDSADNITQCYINEGNASHGEAYGTYASSYLWVLARGTGDDLSNEAGATAKGTIYADVGQVSSLSDIHMSTCAKPHRELAEASTHPQTYEGVSITEQYFNGSLSNVYSVTSTSTGVSPGQQAGDTFSGPLPAAGGTAKIKAQIEWKGDVTKDWALHWNSGYHKSRCNYVIDIVTYNKTALWAAISTATQANYQAMHFRNTSPGSGYEDFKTWNEYCAALQNAWYIYGRKDVRQSQITQATNALTAAMPVYTSSGEWVSGMMYSDADYSQIDTIIQTIPETLDGPDFFAAYPVDPDNPNEVTYGKYYQYTLAKVLNDALKDIETGRPLDARYQGTVDQMRLNLRNAVDALVETSQRQTTKTVSIEFDGNREGVTGIPASSSTRLTGSFARPTTTPSVQYYAFTGWYYDKEATKPVTWPLYIDYTDDYFKANLDVKNDNGGVAYTVYAGWRLTGKTLSFDTNGGNEMETIVGENGARYSGPTEIPTKYGCVFLGWYADSGLNTPVNWDTFTFGSLSTVYAKWEEDLFNVTFDANGGAFLDQTTSITVRDIFGLPVTVPQPPLKDDIGFVGWFYEPYTSEQMDANLAKLDEDPTKVFPVDMDTFTFPGEDIVLYAGWSIDYCNVVFDPRNGTPPTILSCEASTRVQRPEDPVRPGYTFKNWYRLSDNRVQSFSFIIRQNVSLYAVWTPLKYDVTFNAGEGTMAETFNASSYLQMKCGTEIPVPDDPVREDYVFTGWTLDGEPYTLSTVPASNIDLVASWEEEPYVATFRLRTDAGDTVSQGDVITATVSLQANRYVTNHQFLVYYDSRYLQPAINGKAVTSSISGTTACAKIANRAYFTLVRNSGGQKNVTDCGTATGRVMAGIRPATQYFPEDWIIDNYTLKEEYSHYEFVYFNVTDQTGSNYTRTRPAQEQDLASFQFIVRKDAPVADGVTNYAQLLLYPGFTRTPDRPLGKTAACLQAGPDYENKKDWDNTTNVIVDGDHRFAVTQMQVCHIDFVSNGGSSVDSVDEKQGGTIALPLPTREYYIFQGWTLTNDPDDVNYVSTNNYVVPMQGNLTLYAKWVGKQVTYYVRHHKQNVDASGFIETYEQQSLKAAVGTEVTATAKNYPGFTCTNPTETGVVRGDTANPLVFDLWYLRNTVTLTLNANGGKFQGGQQTVSLSGLYEANVTGVPADPTCSGYTFGGWEYQSMPYTISKYPAENTTITAKWTAKTITVRFFLDGSETPYATLTGNYGDPITAPSVSVSEGRIFSGWKNSSGTSFGYTTFPADDEDFFGSIDLDGYWLTLYINDEQYGDPIEVRTGTQVTEAFIGYTPNPGYTFGRWRLEQSRTGAVAVFPMTLTADMTLYGYTSRASYSITTIVYYDGEPEEGPSVENIMYGMPFELPEPDDETDDGYGFRGWYIDPEMKTLYQKPATMPAENIVLYGEYYEMTGTIEFNLNNGTGTPPASITVPLDTTVDLPDGSGFSRQYYVFGGWATTPTGINPITEYTIDDEETITLYAIWKVNYLTVSFNLNGADSGTKPANIKVEVGDTIAAADLPDGADFVRSGFIFGGWAETATAKTALESFTATGTGAKPLYAVWIADTVELIAAEDSTTVVDNEHNFIYGLEYGLSVDDLNERFVDVFGNGHVEVETQTGMVGTGTVVKVINDYSGNVDATYEIVIFGDLNGDGMLNAADVSAIRSINARLSTYAEGSAQFMAADINSDGMINAADVAKFRSANARLTTLPQTVTTE